MSLREHKGRQLEGSGSGWSRLETLPDDVIEQLKLRQYQIGQTIGHRYKLKSLLGTGAMGQVFVAENMAIGVEVAVKLLKAELIASKEFRQRFQKEAEAVGAINHQNVARFLDLVVGDPTFLVMEYARGPTLHQLIEREKRLDYERALTIAVRLCWGLHAAHEHGIVHRDLKPANIILAADAEIGEQPKIIDFGLAKLAAATSKAELTRTGQIVGTPEYMAPEQIEGRQVDARADVYSLGCVLYKLLVGHPPFPGDDDVQVLYRQLHQIPTPPSALVAGIPTKIDVVLGRALAKSPDERYANMRELADALNHAHDRRRGIRTAEIEPIARPATPPIALIAATTLVVGAVGGMLLGRKPSSAPAKAKVVAQGSAAVVGPELLIVTTEPPGTAVTLDGKALGDTTPIAQRGVAIGKHTVKLTHAGFGDVERNVEITTGQRAVLDVTLPPLSRKVRVRTIPTGAAVYLENRLVSSSTPTDISLEIDEFYTLRVEKLGFEPLSKNITPDDTATELELRLDEEKQPMGYLWIDTNGIADVWIDGRATGFTAPTLGLRLPVGQHAVELRDSSGARSRSLTVKLLHGESQHVTLDVTVRK